jgi:hypothetical protein
MEFLRTIEGVRVIFITGIVNAVIGLAMVSTCRWAPLARLTRGFAKSRYYQRFYALHNYFWWLFWISVAVHVVFAVSYIGFPF